MRQTRAIIVTALLSLGLLGAFWAAGAQEGRSLWTPPAILPPDENLPLFAFPSADKNDKNKKGAYPEQAQPIGVKPKGIETKGVVQADLLDVPRSKANEGAKILAKENLAFVVEEPGRVQLMAGTLPEAKAPAPVENPPQGVLPLPNLPGPSGPPLPAPMFPPVAPLPVPQPEAAKTVVTMPTPMASPPEAPSDVKIVAPAPVVVPAPVKEVALPAPTSVERGPADGIKSFVRIRPDSPRIAPVSSSATTVVVPAFPGKDLPAPSPIEVKGTTVSVPTSNSVATSGTSASGSLQTPAILVEKRAMPSPQPADGVQYQIVVRNLGALPAQQVRIEDELPVSAKVLRVEPTPRSQGSTLVWTLAPVAPHSEQIIRLTLDAGVPAELMNRTTVIVSAASTISGPVHVAERPPINAGGLAVRVIGPTQILVGQPALFEIRVTNQSGRPVTGLVLNGHLPEGLSHPQGRDIEGAVDGVLPMGETRSISLTTTAVQAGTGILAVKVTTLGGPEASAQAAVEIGAEALQVSQSMSGRFLAGREGDCRIEIKNCSNQTLRRLSLTEQVPSGLDFVGASDRGSYRANERKVTWQIEQVAPGQSQTVTIRLFAAKAGQYQNQVTAQSDGDSAAVARSTGVIVVDPNSPLSVTIVNRDQQVELGRETVYEIQVANTATVPMTKVQVQVLFPPGLSPRGAQAPAKTNHTVDRQAVTFEPLPSLGPQAQAIYRVTAQAQQPGTQHVRFAVVSDQVRTPVMRETTIMVNRE